MALELDDVQPLEAARRLLRRWHWPVLAALVGAACGLAASLALPPRYEAAATLGVNIHYGVTRPLELVVEDRVLHRVSVVILSDSTLEPVLAALTDELRGQRGWDSPAALRRSLRLDRRLTDWNLVAVDEDPALAARLASLWADAALAALSEARRSGWEAALLAGGWFEVTCEAVTPSGPAPESAYRCRGVPPPLNPTAIAGDLSEALARSRGILPTVSVELAQQAETPERPVARGRGELAGAGGALGLLAGMGLALRPAPPARPGRRTA